MSAECETCTQRGRRGYCAPGRCYCGHEACHAFASWVPLPALPETTPKRKGRRNTTWDDREGLTWIDQL